MATKNAKWFNEFSAKFGVNFQVIKGNGVTVHVAVIGGKEYTALAQLSKGATEQLFKDIASGVVSMPENAVCVTSTGKVSLNGTRHDILDVVKGIPATRLIDIMDAGRRDSTYYGIGTWLYDFNNRVEYIKTLNYTKLNDILYDDVILKMYLDTGKKDRPVALGLKTAIEEIEMILSGD